MSIARAIVTETATPSKLLREAIATLDTESGQAVRSFPVRDAEAAMARSEDNSATGAIAL
jgi:hypothetical protein